MHNTSEGFGDMTRQKMSKIPKYSVDSVHVPNFPCLSSCLKKDQTDYFEFDYRSLEYRIPKGFNRLPKDDIQRDKARE